MTTVSAVIPTVGRESLKRAVASAVAQGTCVNEIIIVNAAADSLPELEIEDDRVKVIDAGRASSARARNVGVAAATGDWVALLDDDDEWHDGYIDVQLAYALRNNLDVVISAALVQQGSRQSIRPTREISSEQNVLQAFYGVPRLWSSPFFAQTSCVVLKRAWARDHPVDEHLEVREDVWWLYELQRNGAVVGQHLDALCTVNRSPSRSWGRESKQTVTQWVDRLSVIDRRLARGFAWGIGLRTAALARNWGTAMTALHLGWKNLL